MSAIQAQQLSKRFLLRHNATFELKVQFLGLLHPSHRQRVEEFWALKDVSLTIERGEAVGLIGRNGSGKSTLLKLIAAIHRPTTGTLLVARGARIASMIELGIGFHPELTGRENIFLNAAIHGLARSQIERIYQSVVDYSGLEHFIDVPIKNYSSGMHMRLGFAIAANLDPDILLLDEIFAVGDADFQQRCVATIRRFLADGKTILFVSHSPDAVRTICRRVCVLDLGRLVFDGELERGLAEYQRSNSDGAERRGEAVTAAPGEPAGPAIESSAADAEAGAGWALELLRGQGLQPTHRVLDAAFGRSDASSQLRGFLGEGRYLRLTDAVTIPTGFEPDVILVQSLFPSVTFNVVAKTIAALLRDIQPAGRVYATWFENPHPEDYGPIAHPHGLTTYPDRPPYHYPFTLIRHVCDSIGVDVARIDGPAHPRGESVLLFTRRASS